MQSDTFSNLPQQKYVPGVPFWGITCFFCIFTGRMVFVPHLNDAAKKVNKKNCFKIL